MGMLRGPLRGTGIYVDYFAASCIPGAAYFLTHYHADHMDGLSEGWARGPLYCSSVTARLLLEVRKVSRKVVRKRAIDHPFELTDPLTQTRLTATLVDAGHCPGSVMVVLEGLSDGAVVHTGDFRFYEGLICNAALRRVADSGRCAQLYLDTSWAHEAFEELPAKETSTAQLLDLIDRYPNEAVVLHSHGLGDEELLSAVATRFPNERFLVADAQRLEVLKIAVPELNGLQRFQRLDRADADQYSKEQRFFIVKSGAQKRKLGLQGVEISCSTLWWAKAIHDEVKNVQHPVRDPRTGAWHVLWAMHSSLAELQELVSWLRPQCLEGICPVICHEESPTNPLSRFQDLLASLQESVTSDSSPSRSPHNDAVRCKVLASTAAYRAELTGKTNGASIAAAASANIVAAVADSDSRMGEGESLCGLLQQTPQKRGSQGFSGRDSLRAIPPSAFAQAPKDAEAKLIDLIDSPPAVLTEIATLVEPCRCLATPAQALPPSKHDACPSTQQEDSDSVLTVPGSQGLLDGGLLRPQHDCADTLVETDSGELSELSGQVAPLNLAEERLPPASTARASSPRRRNSGSLLGQHPKLTPAARGRWDVVQSGAHLGKLRGGDACGPLSLAAEEPSMVAGHAGPQTLMASGRTLAAALSATASKQPRLLQRAEKKRRHMADTPLRLRQRCSGVIVIPD